MSTPTGIIRKPKKHRLTFTQSDLWLIYELLNDTISANGTDWSEEEIRLSNRLHKILYASTAGGNS